MSNKKKLATDTDKEVKKMGSRLENSSVGVCCLYTHTHTKLTHPPKKIKANNIKIKERTKIFLL